MARYVVTGAAGFIGSHLCDRLLADDHEVVGIDSFEDYYPRPLKEANLQQARDHESFTLLERNLLDFGPGDLRSLVDGAKCVYHLAAQAGVRASWGTDFRIYTDNNVLGTQIVLEVCREVDDPLVVKEPTMASAWRTVKCATRGPLRPPRDGRPRPSNSPQDAGGARSAGCGGAAPDGGPSNAVFAVSPGIRRSASLSFSHGLAKC